MNQIKSGAILSYISLILSVGIALIYTPILINNLGQSEYGVYSLMAAFVGYLTILDMGLGNAIVRYVARTRANNDREQESKLSGMFLMLFLILGVLVVIAGSIMYYQIDLLFGNKLEFEDLQLAKTMAIILIANFALSFPLSVFGAIVQAHERFVFLKLTNIIRTFLTPVIIVPMLFLGYGSVMVVALTSIMNILFLLLNVWYCFNKLNVRVKFEKFDKKLLKEVLIYSIFIFINAIMDKIYWSTDQVILGAVSGAGQVAIYAVAMQFIMIYMSMSTAISGLFLPKVSIMEMNGATNKAFSDLFIKIGRIQSLVMAFILGEFIVIGLPFIELWLDETYRDVYVIALIIMIPFTIPLIQNIGISILQAKNLHGFRSIAFIITAIINVIISIPVAKDYGYIGVSLITGITLFVNQVIILNTYYYIKLKINIPHFWMSVLSNFIVTIIAVALIIGVRMHLHLPSILVIFVNGVGFALIYLILLWLFVIKPEEKLMIRKKLQK